MPVGVTWSCHALAVPVTPVTRSAVGILELLFPHTIAPVAEPHKGAQRLLGHGGGVLPEVSSAVGLIGIVCPLGEHGGKSMCLSFGLQALYSSVLFSNKALCTFP